MSEAARIAVVGASLGGLRAAEQLRAAGWEGEIQVIGEEPHPPYNRPPLSKELLTAERLTAEQALEKVVFRRRRSTQGITFRLGTRVSGSDLRAKTLQLADAEIPSAEIPSAEIPRAESPSAESPSAQTLSYDGLVIASGLRARRLEVPGPAGGRYTVRTLEDSLALREALTPGARVVVIGAGFIGCEIAASAVDRGCRVTLVEGGKGPMHRPLGAQVAAAFRARLAQHGIRCLSQQYIQEFTACPHHPDQVSGVLLASTEDAEAEQLAADVVVEAVGSVPNTEWLQGNGLDLSDGVLADAHLRVIGAEHAVAVGDIVRFPDLRLGELPRRVEHWATPGDTARTAARTLAAELAGGELSPPCDALPAFWSDQFGLRITGLGSPALAEETTVLEGSLEALDEGAVIGYLRGGQLIGAVLAGAAPQTILQYRKELTALPA